ncbi:hypothetical protein [Pedobacter metabolipauper]|uniref:Uncharacterized protein n=1 Tax=Pedobacter metabolipauper TaxID=425513 RepID=A0A4R6STI2_9SPHI|nr:hypothetical protein [Pedobacter metabolipauper]TDQ08060.1 hypothetical protein ATK78_2561 [Pedobacter metabolipauper]
MKTSLEEITKRLNGKVSSQNLFNANFNGKSLKKIVINNYRNYKVQLDIYNDLLSINIKIESDWAFSINNPDEIFNYKTPITLKNYPYKVYISEARQYTVKNFIENFRISFFDKISGLGLSNIESVFLYRNVICFGLNYERNLVGDLEYIINTIESNEEIFFKGIMEPRFYKKNIPEKLRHLIPLIKKWGISDDDERTELIDAMSEKQKKKLVNEVSPHFNEVNEFLNSFGDNPMSEEAMLLGNLAELVSELIAN